VSDDSTVAEVGARPREPRRDEVDGESGDETLSLRAAESDAELARLHGRRGELLGRYVLLDPIGRGGMGVVYAAYDPELDRRIALKLLRGDEDERGRARLLREAQAMAKLVHPNVITVHDVGTFAGGVFVAMELVDGMDLRRWLATGPHGWREVLAVLEPAGRGLVAAHRAGLVHRDFKPANVLLGKRGEVKVVDFGLARQLGTGLDTGELLSLERRLALESPSGVGIDEELTATGTLLGTPAYMAPEQHKRRELDARSDQYSYCVALYEALFGQRPFEGGSRMALALATNRGEVLPPPRGHAVPPHVVRAVLRGLEPQPGDRFPSMLELLEALGHDPARRRRRLATGAATVLLLGVGIYGYVRTPTIEPRCEPEPGALAGAWDDERREALAQAFASSELPYAIDTARFTAERLDAWAERWGQARSSACEATHVARTQPESVLALREACLQRQRKDLAAVAGLLVEGRADAIERADRLVASLPAPEACGDVEALGRLPPPADPHTAAAVEAVRGELSVVRALRHAGRYADGLPRAEQARVDAEATGHAPVLAEALDELAEQQRRADRPDQAIDTLHKAARAATVARHDEVLAWTWLALAWDVGMGRGDHDGGLQWAEYAEAVIDRMGRPDRLLAELSCTQGNLHWDKGELELALARLTTCLEVRERVMPGDPLVANALAYLGNLEVQLGHYEQAEASFRRGLELAIAAHGPSHPLVASMHNGLGVALFHAHRRAEAEAEYQRAYDIDVVLLGPDHPDLLYSLGNIAMCRMERGEYTTALAAMRRVEALVRKAFPPEHREVGLTAHNIAELLALQGQHAEALAEYDHALAVRTKAHGPDDPYVANTLTGRAEVLLGLGRGAEALVDLERALAIRERAHDPQRDDFGRTRFALAQALEQTGGDPARARRLAEAAQADLAEGDSPLAQARRDALAAWLAAHPGPSAG